MEYILSTEKPHQKFFEEISRIPRKSFYEQAVSDYVAAFAEERGLWYYQDSIGNVIIKKPGARTFEKSEPVMLQAHLDMVCEKEIGSSFDFLTEPISLTVEDGWLKAGDTTLGADDGAGVALMLAILNDRTAEHPPLECVFTVQEEDGMGGALNLDYSRLTAKRLIALDGLEEGTTILSTTGINCGFIIKECPLIHNDKSVYSLKISGLRGGHAALNIGKGQGNAVKITAEILSELYEKHPLRLISMEGGTILNGIPRECEALFAFSGRAEELHRITGQAADRIRGRLNEKDPDLAVAVGEERQAAWSLDEASTDEVIRLIGTLPFGVREWSSAVPDFPVASWNLGTVSMSDGTASRSRIVRAGYACRSTSSAQIAEMVGQTMQTAEEHHAVYEEKFHYSGYTIEDNSPLIRVWSDVFKEETGKDLVRRRIHSGTDAGTIAEKMGGMDIIVLMPNTLNVHTPQERMDLSSFDRTEQYLRKILRRL